MFFSPSASAVHAGFSYTIENSSIICTDTSTDATSYCWNVTIDGVGAGTTGWITNVSGRSFIFTVTRTCQVQITHAVRNATTSDVVQKGMGYVTPVVDHPTYQNCTNRKLCEDNSFYWYADDDGVYRCHNQPMTMPWNKPRIYPEAGYPQFPDIQFGYFTLNFTGILFFVIVIFISLYIYTKVKDKGGKNIGTYIIKRR